MTMAFDWSKICSFRLSADEVKLRLFRSRFFIERESPGQQ